MTTQDWLTIGSLVVGALGVAFGVYSHFATRRLANLTDFGLPDEFFFSLNNIPIAIVVKSTGDKTAEGVNIRVDTVVPIVNLYITCDEPYEKKEFGFTHAQVRIPSLNPSEEARILVQFERQVGLKNYISSMSVTHSEGIGIDRKLSNSRVVLPIKFLFFNFDIVYDFENRRIEIE